LNYGDRKIDRLPHNPGQKNSSLKGLFAIALSPS